MSCSKTEIQLFLYRLILLLKHRWGVRVLSVPAILIQYLKGYIYLHSFSPPDFKRHGGSIDRDGAG